MLQLVASQSPLKWGTCVFKDELPMHLLRNAEVAS